MTTNHDLQLTTRQPCSLVATIRTATAERGQTLTEYSLIFAFVVILCLVGLQTLSGAVSAALSLIVPSL